MATPIPDNDAVFTLDEIVSATGATRVGPPAAATSVRGVTSDSRRSLEQKLFVALKGEHFDGHRFVEQAAQNGAAAVLIEDAALSAPGASVLHVPSCLDALGALANLHRRRWGGQVVAVGGSAGKTSTRCAISALLGELWGGAVHSSAGNLNNRIGVPMVLLGLRSEHRIAVVEIGTNQRGEVPALARVSEPDVAVLTLVALEHSAGLGSLDDIEQEEGALLQQVRRIAIANGDVERALRQLQASPAAAKLSYGLASRCDYHVVERAQPTLHEAVVRFRSAARPLTAFRTSLLGMPGALAALAAVCVADALNGAPISQSSIERALSAPGVLEAGRLHPLELQDGTVLLDDSYNANPASMRAAIEFSSELARGRGARLFLVLGEMRELGDASREEHAGLADAVVASGAAGLIAVGGDAQEIAQAVHRFGVLAEFSPTAEVALPLCQRQLQPGDVVLFKASRGIGLERVVSALRAKGSVA